MGEPRVLNTVLNAANPSEVAQDCICIEVATSTIICTCCRTLGITFAGVAAGTAVLSLGGALALPLAGYALVRWASSPGTQAGTNTQLATRRS
jgi:hypothetical protein